MLKLTRRDRRRTAGFTLVEILVVIALVAIVAGIAVPVFSNVIAQASTDADAATDAQVQAFRDRWESGGYIVDGAPAGHPDEGNLIAWNDTDGDAVWDAGEYVVARIEFAGAGPGGGGPVVPGVSYPLQTIPFGSDYFSITPDVTGMPGPIAFGALNLPPSVGFDTLTGTLTGPAVGDWGLWNADKLSAGPGAHTCAVTTNRDVKCWGLNTSGQLGDGTTTNRSSAQNATTVALGGNVDKVGVGNDFSCALTALGGVKCWGANNRGQLGRGNTTASTTPVDVSGLTAGVLDISVGGGHTCALLSGGAVRCWGNNGVGQIGDGTTTDRTTSVQVLTGVNSIGVGNVHSCAVATVSGLQCWGQNSVGELGDGTNTNRLVPTAVSGLASGVTRVVAGPAITCALNAIGSLQCWGLNNQGQLGIGNTTNRNTPQAVTGLAAGVTDVALSSAHACAVLSTGEVKCWGDNSDNQLGNGARPTDSNVPITPFGMESGLTDVEVGTNYTCAITTSEGLRCFGRNTSGQLGLGATSTRANFPVDAPGVGAPPGFPATVTVEVYDEATYDLIASVTFTLGVL